MNSLLQRSRYLHVWLGCLPALLAFAAYTISAQHVESVRATLATDNFLSVLSQLLSTVKDAETGQRGYLLTGLPQYRTPYENAMRVIDTRLAGTERQASANGVTGQQIVQLHNLMQEKLAELRLTIVLRETKGAAAALDEVETGRGQLYMDQLRDLIGQIASQQREKLTLRLEKQRHSQSMLDWVLGIGVASGLLTLYLAAHAGTLYAAQRDRAESEIRLANETLELRVNQRTAELQRSNEDLLQFAYIASHDLQEPLRTVGSYIGLLARRYGSQMDETAQIYMRYAVDGAARMQTLINDLLLYSRAGTQTLQTAIVPAEQIVSAALRNLDASIRETGAVVSYSSLPAILVDESKLIQVFQNLIGNAIKFHKPAEAPKVTISANRESNEWVFAVSDNGVGFEEKYTDRIFQVFQRLHGVGKYPGNGIGLAITKRIVEHHGGRLWAESRPGEGSCCSFTVPAAPAPEKPEPNRRNAVKREEARKAVTNV